MAGVSRTGLSTGLIRGQLTPPLSHTLGFSLAPLTHTHSRCTWLCTAGSHPSPVNHNVAKIQPLLPLPFTRTPCLYTGYRQRKVNGCDRGHSGWTEPSIIQPGQSNIRSESSSLTHKPQKREGGQKKKKKVRKKEQKRCMIQ